MYNDEFIFETNLYSACFRYFTGTHESDKRHREQYIPSIVNYIKDVFQYKDCCKKEEIYNSQDCLWWAVDEYIKELSKVNMEDAISTMCDIMYNYSYDELLEYAYSLFDENKEVELLIRRNMEA